MVKQWSLQEGNLVKQVKQILEVKKKNKSMKRNNTRTDCAKKMYIAEAIWANIVTN